MLMRCFYPLDLDHAEIGHLTKILRLIDVEDVVVVVVRLDLAGLHHRDVVRFLLCRHAGGLNPERYKCKVNMMSLLG